MKDMNLKLDILKKNMKTLNLDEGDLLQMGLDWNSLSDEINKTKIVIVEQTRLIHHIRTARNNTKRAVRYWEDIGDLFVFAKWQHLVNIVNRLLAEADRPQPKEPQFNEEQVEVVQENKEVMEEAQKILFQATIPATEERKENERENPSARSRKPKQKKTSTTNEKHSLPQ